MALPNEVLAEYFSRPQRKKPENAVNVFDELPKKDEAEEAAENALNGRYYSMLCGIQLKIIHYIFTQCHYTRDKKTLPLSIENIAHSCEINPKSVKKTIQRLVKKQFLTRVRFKAGRGGWTQYELPDRMYYEIIHAQSRVKIESASVSAAKTETVHPVETSVPPITHTTHQEAADPERRYPDEPHIITLEGVDYDVEPLAHIGFSSNHLKQILSQKRLTPRDIQESIYAFAFDLKHNKKKTIDNPISYFMSVVRKGFPYAQPKNYESPSNKAMRVYLESVSHHEKQAELHEKQIMKVQFDEWLDGLTLEEKQRFGVKGVWEEGRPLCRANAYNHFTKFIWPPMLEGMRAHLETLPLEREK